MHPAEKGAERKRSILAILPCCAEGAKRCACLTLDSSFSLIPAGTLAAGVEKLGSSRPDGIVLDLELPDSRGIQTFLRVRKAAPGVPIVILSDVRDELVIVEAIRRGAHDYFVRGQADAERLTRALDTALARRQLASQLERLRKEERGRRRTASEGESPAAARPLR